MRARHVHSVPSFWVSDSARSCQLQTLVWLLGAHLAVLGLGFAGTRLWGLAAPASTSPFGAGAIRSSRTTLGSRHICGCRWHRPGHNFNLFASPSDTATGRASRRPLQEPEHAETGGNSVSFCRRLDSRLYEFTYVHFPRASRTRSCVYTGASGGCTAGKSGGMRIHANQVCCPPGARRRYAQYC